MKQFSILLLVLCSIGAGAQDTAFGIKGGPLLGVQQWNGFEQDLLISYHAIAFIESADENNDFSVFAQAGYHVRGSAHRNQRFQTIGGDFYRPPTRNFEFRNIALTLGGKQKKDLGVNGNKWYYGFGVRGEYTVNTNLKEYEEGNNLTFPGFYPIDFYVNKFNYGIYASGGLEIPFSELVGGIVELSINPDFSKQYDQPEIGNILNPFNPGTPRTIQERSIRNVSVELTVGLRFLRKVIVLD